MLLVNFACLASLWGADAQQLAPYELLVWSAKRNRSCWVPSAHRKKAVDLVDARSTRPALVPLLLHRTHKYKIDAMRKGRAATVRSNLDSCARINPGSATRYYTNAQLEQLLERLLQELGKRFKSAAEKLGMQPRRRGVQKWNETMKL